LKGTAARAVRTPNGIGMENAWSYQLKNGRIGTKNTLFYTLLKRAEIRWDEKVDPDHGWR
jgi:hypothetical protein